MKQNIYLNCKTNEMFLKNIDGIYYIIHGKISVFSINPSGIFKDDGFKSEITD